MIYGHILLEDYVVLTDFPEKRSKDLLVPATMRPILKKLKELGLQIELRYTMITVTRGEYIALIVNGEDVGTVIITTEKNWVAEIAEDLTKLANNPDKYGFAE